MDLATFMSYGSMSAFTTIGEKPVQVIYVPFQIAGPTAYPQPPPYSSIPMQESYGIKEELASPKRLTPSSSPEIDVGNSPSASELATQCPSPSYISLKRQASDVLEGNRLVRRQAAQEAGISDYVGSIIGLAFFFDYVRCSSRVILSHVWCQED
ncbi:hypothetical protein AAVH_21223 [Aphelenchoides avenae]|nr:hypothetical protein AAVH_21223 [Aphelenchus avenae]